MTFAHKKSFPVIAIDGPAASGKGTLSRQIAAFFGLAHLDTGLTYRAVAKAMLDAKLDLENEEMAIDAAKALVLEGMDQKVLSNHAIGEAASKIAVITPLRALLVEKQRQFSRQEPGTVLDGRDIGTVVCPNASVKLFVTASAQVRAKRRYDEIISKGEQAEEHKILQDIRLRDARDMAREDSPLKPAQDALLIDTSEMDIETAFNFAKEHIQRVLAQN